MNLKKLLDLFEAPANLNYKGTAGTQAIQQATNQAKPGTVQNVNKIKVGQQLTLPGGGSYQVKAGDTMDKIARRNPTSTAPSVTTAPGPAATAPAPSTDNEALKGQVISQAMTKPALNVVSRHDGVPPPAPAPVNPADALGPGEEIVDKSAPTDTRGAAAMASTSAEPAPVQTAPAPVDVSARPDMEVAQAPSGNIRPGRVMYGDFSEDDKELNELMRLSGRPVNEKAVSKQQQKFMGMVHAIQKGDQVKGASPKLKKVAKTMSKKDARDFASTKHKGLPSKVTEGVMLEAGSALEHIISKFKHETRNFLAGNELDNDLYEALFDYYLDAGDMPYGVAKARDGDPYQWIDNKFESDLAMMGQERDFNTPSGLGHDHELTDLARLAGLTTEDGPGASMLYSKDKPDSFGDKLKSAGKSIRQAIDKATLPSAMHADYDRIEAEKDRRAAGSSTDLIGAATGSAGAAADNTGKLKEDEELNQMRRIAGLKEAQPPSPGAANPHAARERERVVSPKVDKYDKDQEAAEKARRWIVDKESPNANNFGRKIGKAVAEPIAAIKSAWHGASDAWDHEMGNDTAPDPKPPVSVVKKNDWKGDKDNPALKECGDNMSMDSQQDSMNISTNMSSDGTKSVTVSAQGDQAAALIDMLRLAGMNSDHVAHDHEPEIVMVGSDDDEMMEQELEEAKKRKTRYSNTPDEEYETVDSIIRQGNDLNREKRQFAGKPKLGDNPMAESLLDADLDAMLESILIREEDSAAKKVGDAVKNPSDAAKKVGDKVKGRVTFTQTGPHTSSISSSTGRIRATIDKDSTTVEPGEPLDDKEKTNEGVLDDVSNWFGDIAGTEASKLRHSGQLQALDAMRKQYKGTPYEKQVNDRYQAHLDRLQGDKGEVVDKKGEPIKVLPPDQWKGGNQ